MIDPRRTTIILIVDDEPLIRLYATDVLEDAGFTVIEAEDTESALEALDRHLEIGVLFTDIHMPGAYDGLELARRVNGVRPDIKLIIASGRGRPMLGEIPDHGQFLAKPYDGYELSKLVTAAHSDQAFQS